MDIKAPMCVACERYIRDPQGPPRCKAFPNGIPSDIFSGGVDHREHIEGDTGITFVQDPTLPDFDFPDFDSFGA